MNTKHSRFIAFLLLVFVPTGAFSFENLSDLQLDAVAAGSVGPEHERTEAMVRIPFRYSGRKGSVDGEVVVLPMATYTQASSLQLTGNAQANLQSLININAVSSPIQVLLNLNISVNSNIGNVNQLNNLLSSSFP
ncbi:MAG: hypothetical protein O6927_09895 [Gammaproteobacteria bacterium]|nr:hypothetical protein [Gammaproteobacteria bacterium]